VRMIPLIAWLKSIVAAIVLAGFLEMLLPNNELKGVTKLVMGLLILMILLQPLLQIFHLPLEFSWPVPGVSGEPPAAKTVSTETIVKEGLELRRQWTAQFQDRQREAIGRKIGNILRLIDEIDLVALKPIYEGDRLLRVRVETRWRTAGPIESGQRREIEAKIRNSVQLVTDLSNEQIEVIWRG
jgi:stage III sporulation protein AF